MFGVHSFCCSTATSSPVIITTGTPYQLRHQRVEPAFAGRTAVDLHVLDDAGAGVREQAARRVGLGVIADEDHRVERLVEPLDHAVALEAVADQPGARIEILGKQVALAAVRVVDDDFGGAAVERAADRGVGVLGHQLARAVVFGLAGAGLIVADHAADAFHVDRDVDLLAPALQAATKTQTRRTRRTRSKFSKGTMHALPKKFVSSC